MFAACVSILTCLAMLWHSVGGCCLHHDHCCSESDVAVVAYAEQTVHCGCSHQHSDHAISQPAHSDDAPESPASPLSPCGETSCVYIKTPSADAHHGADFLVLGVIAEVATVELKVSGPSLPADGTRFGGGDHVSPLDLCALIQSWQL